MISVSPIATQGEGEVVIWTLGRCRATGHHGARLQPRALCGCQLNCGRSAVGRRLPITNDVGELAPIVLLVGVDLEDQVGQLRSILATLLCLPPPLSGRQGLGEGRVATGRRIIIRVLLVFILILNLIAQRWRSV